MSTPPPIIRASGVSKKFRLRKQRPFLVHSLFSPVLRKARSADRDFWALQDVSFEVPRGGAMGIIGGNGAGKSTLLSLLIGSSRPTSGDIRVDGKIGALLELGAGFHPDLTGRENIRLNASLSGLSQAEIDEKFDSIIEFTELGEFIDVPIRNYSSGMHVRLGFSVAIHVDPEILIVDEALAVGDQKFQDKCLQRIEAMREAGVTFLVVSHGLTTIRDLCTEALWLDHGRVVACGPSQEICDAYASGSLPGNT